jgi:hypothetical protein
VTGVDIHSVTPIWRGSTESAGCGEYSTEIKGKARRLNLNCFPFYLRQISGTLEQVATVHAKLARGKKSYFALRVRETPL